MIYLLSVVTMCQQITYNIKNIKMKEEDIKIRITSTLKRDFQDICEIEETTMSNKINSFIVKEVKTKKIKHSINDVLTKQLIRFGVMNGNGRLYQKDELTKIILDDDGFETTQIERLNNGVLYGQFGHLDNGDIIHKYNATHSIKNFRIDGDWLIGDVTILNPSILPIIDVLVFRPRAFGEIGENGVVNGLEIIGFDAILKTEDKFN